MHSYGHVFTKSSKVRDFNRNQLRQFSLSTPLHHTHGDLTSLAPHERLSELPVVPREKSDTGAAAGENPRDAPVIAR